MKKEREIEREIERERENNFYNTSYIYIKDENIDTRWCNV